MVMRRTSISPVQPRVRRVTNYVRKTCSSTILDRRENAARAASGEPPRANTRAGQSRLAAKLVQALESTDTYEYSYVHRPPPIKTAEELETAIRFRDYCQTFSAQGESRRRMIEHMSETTRSVRSEMAAEAIRMVELERLFYALEMDLPRPPHLTSKCQPPVDGDSRTG
jgi:hypothetical protein